MPSYPQSMDRIFSRYSSEMYKRSRSLDLVSLSSSQESDLWTSLGTNSSSIRSSCGWLTFIFSRISPVFRSTATEAIGCSSAITTCWLRKIRFATLLKLRIWTLNGISGSTIWAPLAQDSCKLWYSLELNCGTIRPCYLFVSFTGNWECGGIKGASEELITGVRPDAVVVSSKLAVSGACSPLVTSFCGLLIMRMDVPSSSSSTLFSGKMASTNQSQKSVPSTAGAARGSHTVNSQRVKWRPSRIDNQTVLNFLSRRLSATHISGKGLHEKCFRNRTLTEFAWLKFGPASVS